MQWIIWIHLLYVHGRCATCHQHISGLLTVVCGKLSLTSNHLYVLHLAAQRAFASNNYRQVTGCLLRPMIRPTVACFHKWLCCRKKLNSNARYIRAFFHKVCDVTSAWSLVGASRKDVAARDFRWLLWVTFSAWTRLVGQRGIWPVMYLCHIP